ncbi:MAG: ORF6N domain-containing protein [Candidatus Firestonebacteria bacterium]
MNENHPILINAIETKIYRLRDQEVMLGHDLAELYAVEGFRLNEAVKRNIIRFPSDFMFQITQLEYDVLLSQIAIANSISKSRFLPYAFTEQGISMLSSVLNSERAIRINIEIMRTFVAFRKKIFTQREILAKLENIEGKVSLHENQITTQGEVMKDLVDQIRRMIKAPAKKTNRYGFKKE